MVGAGVGIAILGLIRKGGFDPFISGTFFTMALLELAFRKRKYSNLLSLLGAILLITLFRTCVADLLVVKDSGLEPKIRKESRILIQKITIHLAPGDMVVLRLPKDPKSRVGIVTAVLENARYRVQLLRKTSPQQLDISRKEIAGKAHILPSTQ